MGREAPTAGGLLTLMTSDGLPASPHPGPDWIGTVS